MRILIVEDEQIIAADLTAKLGRLGHDVVGCVIAGREAIAVAEQTKPDVVLMDIQLEGEMTGVEAAEVVRERTGAQIIFVTAFPGFLTPAVGQEPSLCVRKPFSRLQLEAALGEATIRSGRRAP